MPDPVRLLRVQVALATALWLVVMVDVGRSAWRLGHLSPVRISQWSLAAVALTAALICLLIEARRSRTLPTDVATALVGSALRGVILTSMVAMACMRLIGSCVPE